MPRLSALLALVATLATCTADELEDGKFPCGSHGGSCDAVSELCIVAGGCATCVPLPEACDPEATCGCIPPGNDPMFAPRACTDAGSCAPDGDGLVLTCEDSDNWGCG